MGAEIALCSGPRRSPRGIVARSDRQGAFAIALDLLSSDAGPYWIRGRQGNFASRELRVDRDELSVVPWIAIHLQMCSVVSARAVGVRGEPVPDARFLIIVTPTKHAGSAGGRSLSGSVIRAQAGSDGRIDVLVPPGRILLAARRGYGVFGRLIRGEVAPTDNWGAGDVQVASHEFRARLVVKDKQGEPVAGAGVRLEIGDSFQRFIAEGAGPRHRLVHFQTGEDGGLEIPLRCEDIPVWLAVGAMGYSIVRLVIDRSSPGEEEIVVRLRVRRRIPIRVEVGNGRAYPVRSPLQWRRVRRIRPDSGSRGALEDGVLVRHGVSSTWSGVCPDGIPPESFLRDIYYKRYPVPSSTRGEFTAFVDSPGRYRIEAVVPPDTVLRAEATVPQYGDAAGIELALPPGRFIDVRSTEGAKNAGSVLVWAGRDGWPPGQLPEDRRERRHLLASCGSMNWSPGSRKWQGRFWFPEPSNAVVFGLNARSGTAVLHSVPLPVDARGGVEIDFRGLRSAHDGNLLTVCVHARGQALRQQQIPVRVRVEGGEERILFTDSRGEIQIRGSGRIDISLPEWTGLRAPQRIDVSNRDRTVVLDFSSR